MEESKKRETKKEHYVPRCYLERWKNDNGHVHVYDKEKMASRTNNVKDIACERYFYDIDYKELSEQKIELLKKLGIEPTQDEQFIEHFLSRQVEGIYSELLKKILDKEITPWYEKNCFFISQVDKLKFAICIAFQHIRTNETRKMLTSMSKCLEKVFQDMNVSDDVLNTYTIPKGDEKNIQGNMLLDIEGISGLADAYYNLTWILLLNKTSEKFYTSDNPIGTKAHVENPYMSMAGVRSEGVEVYLPLSPLCMLIMCDGVYHKELSSYDKKYLSVCEEDIIEEYNFRSVHNGNRCIYSKDGDFEMINKMVKQNPYVFDVPKIQVSWGGKNYFAD